MATTKNKAAGPATKGIKVVSRPQGGFRRAGRSFSAEGSTLALSELGEDDLQQLRDEPNLIVVDVDLPAP
jgi:hypothetical protein